MEVGRWYENANRRPSDEDLLNPTEYAVDLVHLATMAHRNKVGSLIWACWQPGGAGSNPKRSTTIKSGAMLLMLDRRMAETLAQNMQVRRDDGTIDPRTKRRPMKPYHFDLELKKFLLEGLTSPTGEKEPWPYCYVYPPIGNYTTHGSGCDPLSYGEEKGGRPACWDEKWCCAGTRRSHDVKLRDKYLCQLTAKGQPKWIAKVDVEETHEWNNWRSCWIGDGEPPRPNATWRRLMGPEDGRVEACARSQPTQSDPSRRESKASFPKQGGKSGTAVSRPPSGAASSSSTAILRTNPSGALQPLADDQSEKFTERDRRMKGLLTLQRSFRIWVSEAF